MEGKLTCSPKRSVSCTKKAFWMIQPVFYGRPGFKHGWDFRIQAKTLKLLKSAIKIKVLDTIRPQRYLKDFNKVLKEPKSQEAIKILKSWDAYKGV